MYATQGLGQGDWREEMWDKVLSSMSHESVRRECGYDAMFWQDMLRMQGMLGVVLDVEEYAIVAVIERKWDCSHLGTVV